MYGLLANLLAILHGALVVAVVAGSAANVLGLLRRTAWARWTLCALLVCVAGSDRLLEAGCPLTELEKRLRELHAPGSAYTGAFIRHYFGWIPPWMHTWGAPGVVIAGLLAFPFWWWMDRRRLPAVRPKHPSASL